MKIKFGVEKPDECSRFYLMSRPAYLAFLKDILQLYDPSSQFRQRLADLSAEFNKQFDDGEGIISDYSDSGGYSGYWLCSSNYKESWLKVNLPDYIMKGEYKKEMPTEVSSGLISLHAPNCMSIKVFGDNLALTSKVAHWNDVRKATVVDQGLEYSIKTTYEDSTEDDIKKHRQVLDSGPVILHSPELNLDSKRLIPYVFEHIIIRVEKKRLKQLNPELDQFGKQSYKENNLFRLHVLHTQDLPNNIFYGGIFDNTIDSKLGYFRGVIHGLNEYAERWAEAFSEIVTELMAKLPERSIEIYKPSIFGYKIK